MPELLHSQTARRTVGGREYVVRHAGALKAYPDSRFRRRAPLFHPSPAQFDLCRDQFANVCCTEAFTQRRRQLCQVRRRWPVGFKEYPIFRVDN